MTKKIILPLFLLFSLSIIAQTQHKPCGTKTYSPTYLENHPEEAERLLELENFTQHYISEFQNNAAPREVVTIPVVVHIVYQDASENFTDRDVQAQIDGLTADFRKLNENSAFIPGEFKPIAADVEIEFCLATLDPDGNIVSGINRRQTDIRNIGSTNNPTRRIFYSQHGGIDAWDTDHYLNIWVAQLEAIAGEATRPGMASSPIEDGVIVDPKFFGFFCSNVNNYYLGRTLTHEVGHYFNLLHIWGDQEGCSFDDMVDDTPLQKEPNFDCPEYPKPSTCDSGAINEMTNNFMDYVDDNCMSMFTEGQKLRMLAALNGPRSLLKESQGCAWIRTETEDDNIKIFPNPASDCVHINLNIDTEIPFRMELLTGSGQVIFSKEVFAEDLRAFDVSLYPNGIYFVFFENKNGNNFVCKKLIIDK